MLTIKELIYRTALITVLPPKTMPCRGICIQYEIKKRAGRSIYVDGGSRCNAMCGGNTKYGIFIRWLGIFCPCCGYKLRKHPRHTKSTISLKKIELSRN